MTSISINPRILVVDDDKDIVRLVRGYLSQSGFEVLAAHDGESALHMIRSERPDLVVLDLMLPGRDGYAITSTVRSEPQLSSLPIIMLTARVDDTDKIVGLELGADDYITKPFNPREVVARVRSVLRRANGNIEENRAEVLQAGALLMDVGRHEVMQNGQPIDLTLTEFNLLHTLMAHPGHAFTRAELVEGVMGYDFEGSERTLDSHIKNLRRKIEPDPKQPIYIQTVYGVGYRFS